jgi:hypothetical protein
VNTFRIVASAAALAAAGVCAIGAIIYAGLADTIADL